MSNEPVDIEQLLAQELAGFDPTRRDGSSAPIGGAIINWRELSDEDAPEAWARLRGWVEWVSVRYNIPVSIIPNCWYQHDALVEELSALHTAHLAAFDESDAGFGPIGWHERFAVAMPRLTRAYGGGCSDGHRPLRPRNWSGVIEDQEWETWASTAHAHRGEPTSNERRTR